MRLARDDPIAPRPLVVRGAFLFRTQIAPKGRLRMTSNKGLYRLVLVVVLVIVPVGVFLSFVVALARVFWALW